MDKQQRLTKWNEWVIGASYQYVKNGWVNGSYKCVELNKVEGWVRFEAPEGSQDIIRFHSWRRRFRLIPL